MTDWPDSQTRAAALGERDYVARPSVDLLHLLRILWFGKWVILCVMAVWIGAAGYYAFAIAQPRFTATATLQVEVQPVSLQDVSEQWPNPDTGVASLNTEVTILTSANILGQVVAELDLLNDPEFNRYLTPMSPYAPRAIRTRLRHFLSGTSEAPTGPLAVYEKTIENLRGAVTANRPRDTYIFQISATSGDADKAARIANTAANIYIQNQIAAKDDAAREAVGWLQGRVTELESKLHDQETAITALISTAQIQEDGKLDALSNAVLALDSQIGATEAALAQLQANGSETVRNIAEAQQVATQLAELQAERTRLQHQLSAQSAGLVALHQMQREAEATQTLYQAYNRRLQETRVQQGLAQPNSRIIAAATAGQYAGPRKVYILALAMLVGALTGIALVMLRQSFRNGVYDVKHLQDIGGVPVLASVADTALPRPRKFINRLGQNRLPALAKAVFAIRSHVQLGSPSKAAGSCLLCISAVAEEGAAEITLGLAQALGQAGQRVLLVSADPDALGKLARGLSLVTVGAAGEADTPNAALRPFAGCSFDIVNTHTCDESADLILTDAFAEGLSTLRARYDTVLILGPPINTHPETSVLARQADQALLCARWGRTSGAEIAAALAALRNHEVRIAGTVLTKVNHRKARRWPVPRHSALPI
ncbi:MAG: exopolysaccharide transport family protein [Pseudomonadota bacterium]